MKHLKALLFPLAFAVISTISISTIYSQVQMPIFNSANAAKNTTIQNGVTAPPVDLTIPTLTNAALGSNGTGNLARLGKALLADSTASRGGAFFNTYDSLAFVNSTSSAKFAVTVDSQGNKAQTVDDINVLDFNSDTMYPMSEISPVWYNGATTNTLHSIKSVTISDTGHNGQASPLTEIGFYCFTNTARQFTKTGHEFYGTMGAFDGLTSVSVSDFNSDSPTSIKVVHNGAFFASGVNTRVLQTVDFGPSNQITVFDEPTGPSSFQTFGHIYGQVDGDYNADSSIFGGQTALTSVDLHQSYYGDTSKTQPAVLLNIPANCFKGCTSLKSIQGSRDKIMVGSNQASAINIPSSVQSIGNNAFDGVPVQVLNFPTSLKSLGSKILGPNGDAALTDVIFSDPNPNASFLNGYDWASLLPPNVPQPLPTVHVPYLPSYNGDLTKSPYYNAIKKSGAFNIAWNHATALDATSPTTTSPYLGYIRGNDASDGTFPTNAETFGDNTYKVIPFPENTCIDGTVLNFDPDPTVKKFSLTTLTNYFVHNDKDGPNSLRVTNIDYHVQSKTVDIASLVGTFAVTYKDPGSTILNGTVKSNPTNSVKVSLWDANVATGFTFTPGSPVTKQEVMYKNNFSFPDLTTVLTYSGTGISDMNDDLSITPFNADGDKTPITNSWIKFEDKGSVVNVTGTSPATITDTSTLKYTYNSSNLPANLCRSYQITPSAALRSDATIAKTNASSASIYPLNIWGVQDITYQPVSTEKNYVWDGSTADTPTYPSLAPVIKYINDNKPTLSSYVVNGAIANVKLNGQTAQDPGFNYANGVVSVTIPAGSQNFQDNHKWTFDVQLSTNADSTFTPVSVHYTFNPSVVSSVKWSSNSPGTDDHANVFYNYDATSAPTTAVSLTWNAANQDGSIIDATYSYNTNAMGASKDKFTISNNTISWGGAGATAWASGLIGEKLITLTATITVSGQSYVLTANIHINLYSLQSVKINNAANVYFANPIKVGGAAGHASTAYTYVPTWTNGSAGYDTATPTATWSITTTAGSAAPAWLTIDSTGMLNYTSAYTAGTVNVVATVTVKATPASAGKTDTLPNNSAAQFIAWSVTGVSITTNPFILDSTSNTWLNVIDDETNGNMSPFAATVAGTNLPQNTVTWTLNQDVAASTAGVWNQTSIAPKIDNNGVISWKSGLVAGNYFFTITATSNDDSAFTTTLGTIGGGGASGTEFNIEVTDVDYEGTTVDTGTDVQNQKFYYFQNTVQTWHLHIASTTGVYNPDNMCNWKIEYATGEQKPSWLNFSNPSGLVNSDGNIDLNFGTPSNPILANTDHIDISLHMYDRFSTKDDRFSTKLFTIYLYGFTNNTPSVVNSNWYGTKGYSFNPGKNATGNSSKVSLTYNFTSANKNPIQDAMNPHLRFSASVTTSSGSTNEFTDDILSITYDSNPASASFGQLAWTLNVPYKHLYQYNGSYKVTITCGWVNDTSAPSYSYDYDMGSTTFNFNFNNKPAPNPYIGMGIGIGVGVAVAAALTIFLLIRRRKIYSAIKKEEKEDTTKSPMSVTGF